jgi:hypothetical protein
MNYSEKCKLDTWSKRTQTKPILPAMAGKIALSEVEGPVVFDIEGITFKMYNSYLWKNIQQIKSVL